jgi:hypothetical protein
MLGGLQGKADMLLAEGEELLITTRTEHVNLNV